MTQQSKGNQIIKNRLKGQPRTTTEFVSVTKMMKEQNINQRKKSTEAVFKVNVLPEIYDPENGINMFLRNTLRYNSEDTTLYSYSHENSKPSYTEEITHRNLSVRYLLMALHLLSSFALQIDGCELRQELNFFFVI